jgi:hypothetical protein
MQRPQRAPGERYFRESPVSMRKSYGIEGAVLAPDPAQQDGSQCPRLPPRHSAALAGGRGRLGTPTVHGEGQRMSLAGR